MAAGGVGRLLLRAIQRRPLVQVALFAALPAADARLYRGARRDRAAVPRHAHRSIALGTVIYGACSPLDALLMAEEGAIAVGQRGGHNRGIGHGHGNRVVRFEEREGVSRVLRAVGNRRFDGLLRHRSRQYRHSDHARHG